jgi:hypothetical protein
MPVQANLTDVQNVTFTIANGADSNAQTVTHNLQDQNGAYLTPDEVHIEPVSHAGAQMLATGGVVFYVTRSTPEDGTFSILMSAGQNASGGNWVTVCRVISKWLHSVQSRDHSV